MYSRILKAVVKREPCLGPKERWVASFAPSALTPAIETMYEDYIGHRGFIWSGVMESGHAEGPFRPGGSIRGVRSASCEGTRQE